MAKFKLKSAKFVKLPEKYHIEHETDKGILISDGEDGEWFPKKGVRVVDGGGIEVADWLLSKSDLLSDIEF